jgi:hypothetical protein
MGDIVALGSAVRTMLDNAGTLPVYYGLAPQGSACPYIVFQRQAGRDEYSFTGRMLSADYVVRVVSDRNWPTQAATLYDTLHASIQDALGTVTGFNTLRFRRQSPLEYRDGDGYWHVGGVYRADVCEP